MSITSVKHDLPLLYNFTQFKTKHVKQEVFQFTNNGLTWLNAGFPISERSSNDKKESQRYTKKNETSHRHILRQGTNCILQRRLFRSASSPLQRMEKERWKPNKEVLISF